MTEVAADGLEHFTTHRTLLFTVAYEILGSVGDAEDVVQETWLRWADVVHEEVRDPRAYLVRIATRQALNRLRSLARRREAYVGPWLPEPLLTTPDVADDVELRESVSTAMLLVLESLRPTERAVFVLREVFAFGYDEIAASVGKSEAAVRQIAHRARQHVAARRPRQPVDTAEARAVAERFKAALETGDLQPLLEVMAPDVVLVADGGGVVQAARRPVEGAEKVLRYLGGVGRKQIDIALEPATVNGGAGLLVLVSGVPDGVVSMRVDHGLATELYYVRNPAKLRALGRSTPLER